jgi:hypothetical protein
VTDPLPPAAALPLREGENKLVSPFVRGTAAEGGRGSVIRHLSNHAVLHVNFKKIPSEHDVRKYFSRLFANLRNLLPVIT